MMVVREYCICGCLKGAHDEKIFVCTTRRCLCLRFQPLLSRPGSLRGEITPLAADLAKIRAHNRRVNQRALVGDSE